MEYLCPRDHAEPGSPPIAGRRPCAGVGARRGRLEDRRRLVGELNQIRVVYLIRLHDSRVIDELSSRQLKSLIGMEEMMRQARSRAAVRSIPLRCVLSMSHSQPAANWFCRHLSD